MEPDRMLNVTETAVFFGISERTFYTWLRNGKVPAAEVLPSGRRFWRLSVLQGCIKTTTTPVALAAVA